MNFLHYEFDLSPDDMVEITLDRPANVRMLDETNFQSYRRGERHRYHGGHARQSPVRLAAPHAGRWHVVVDLGGYPGVVRASARVLQGASQ